VVRILYAHMLRRKGMSSGKHSLHTRRNTVLAYLSALKSDELRVFLDFIIEVCVWPYPPLHGYYVSRYLCKVLKYRSTARAEMCESLPLWFSVQHVQERVPRCLRVRYCGVAPIWPLLLASKASHSDQVLFWSC
jgi:hypothetical protein